MKLEGIAFKFGDDINTDYIIPAKRLTSVTVMKEVARYLMEDLDPDFVRRIKPGDLIVAGENFGCGSSREAAPWVIKEAGIGGVVAKSFARIFFRNAINIGLPVICANTDTIENGDHLIIDLSAGMIRDIERRCIVKSEQMPPIMVRMLEEGGIVPFLRKHKGLREIDAGGVS
jgi:3-isopropylmalate/(R)-2-methylmalate dehydratase small subunit